MSNIIKAIAEKLRAENYVILNDFLVDPDLKKTINGVKAAWRSGLLSEGGRMFSKGDSLGFRNSDLRGDQVGWFDGDEKSVASWAKPYMERCDAMISELTPYLQRSGELTNIGGRSPLMVTCYPGGDAYYSTHVDNSPVTPNGRRLTAVLYLNEGWDAEAHGGELRIFEPQPADPDVKSVKPICDVSPLAGRLILFWSDTRVPHAVLPAQAHRFAATLWYFDAQERAQALAAAKAKAGAATKIRQVSTGGKTDLPVPAPASVIPNWPHLVQQDSCSCVVSIELPPGTKPKSFELILDVRPNCMRLSSPRWGSDFMSVDLPCLVECEQGKAVFKHGKLQVTMPIDKATPVGSSERR
mmetsp:Transcript_95782/g.166413  ORF Transcript_95782/g.166413 Transcript_95782/m.166413 type:complete len:355 (-) Transcript_95782:186-1250(-)